MPAKLPDRFSLANTWLLAVCLLLSDLTDGIGVVQAWQGTVPDHGVRLAAVVPAADDGPARNVVVDSSGPQVEVDAEKYNFGKADVGVGGHHEFVFTNIGNEPLLLTRGKSTCGCCTCVCTLQLPDHAVAPGQSAQVSLQWKSKLFVGPFRQTATILTNDPRRREVTLTITGRFTGPVGVVPSQVTFGSVRVGETATSEARVFNYLAESLDIVDYELSNPQLGDYFEISWKPLPAEQVQEEGAARSGFLLRIALRPGLPVGSFRQSVVLTSTLKSVPRIDVPILGSIVRDVSIAGRGWNSHSDMLTMGNIKRSEGAQWPLLIVVRGPHAKDVRLKKRSSVPSWLDVEFAPTQFVADKGLSVTQLKILVAPGREPSEYLEEEAGRLGRITVETGCPALPDLELKVRFAVIE